MSSTNNKQHMPFSLSSQDDMFTIINHSLVLCDEARLPDATSTKQLDCDWHALRSGFGYLFPSLQIKTNPLPSELLSYLDEASHQTSVIDWLRGHIKTELLREAKDLQSKLSAQLCWTTQKEHTRDHDHKSIAHTDLYRHALLTNVWFFAIDCKLLSEGYQPSHEKLNKDDSEEREEYLESEDFQAFCDALYAFLRSKSRGLYLVCKHTLGFQSIMGLYFSQLRQQLGFGTQSKAKGHLKRVISEWDQRDAHITESKIESIFLSRMENGHADLISPPMFQDIVRSYLQLQAGELHATFIQSTFTGLNQLFLTVRSGLSQQKSSSAPKNNTYTKEPKWVHTSVNWAAGLYKDALGLFRNAKLYPLTQVWPLSFDRSLFECMPAQWKQQSYREAEGFLTLLPLLACYIAKVRVAAPHLLPHPTEATDVPAQEEPLRLLKLALTTSPPPRTQTDEETRDLEEKQKKELKEAFEVLFVSPKGDITKTIAYQSLEREFKHLFDEGEWPALQLALEHLVKLLRSYLHNEKASEGDLFRLHNIPMVPELKKFYIALFRFLWSHQHARNLLALLLEHWRNQIKVTQGEAWTLYKAQQGIEEKASNSPISKLEQLHFLSTDAKEKGKKRPLLETMGNLLKAYEIVTPRKDAPQDNESFAQQFDTNTGILWLFGFLYENADRNHPQPNRALAPQTIAPEQAHVPTMLAAMLAQITTMQSHIQIQKAQLDSQSSALTQLTNSIEQLREQQKQIHGYLQTNKQIQTEKLALLSAKIEELTQSQQKGSLGRPSR